MGTPISARVSTEMVATEMLPIFLLAGVSNVLGHGGMVWPPIWQDGYALPLDEVWNNHIEGNPTMKDPATGRWINNAKSWLTDQSYTGGHGEFPNGTSLHYGPLWLSLLWRHHGRPPRRLRVPATPKWGSRNLDL